LRTSTFRHINVRKSLKKALGLRPATRVALPLVTLQHREQRTIVHLPNLAGMTSVLYKRRVLAKHPVLLPLQAPLPVLLPALLPQLPRALHPLLVLVGTWTMTVTVHLAPDSVEAGITTAVVVAVVVVAAVVVVVAVLTVTVSVEDVALTAMEAVAVAVMAAGDVVVVTTVTVTNPIPLLPRRARKVKAAVKRLQPSILMPTTRFLLKCPLLKARSVPLTLKSSPTLPFGLRFSATLNSLATRAPRLCKSMRYPSCPRGST
jgi:hypothetical protein